LALTAAIGCLVIARRRRGRPSARTPGRERPKPQPVASEAASRRSRPATSGRGVTAIGIVALLVLAVAANTVRGAASVAGSVRVTVLDVGQGDAILVESDRGSRMLVDGGPEPARLIAAVDARLPPWDRRIDVLVLTHPHEDHAAGLPVLVDRYGIGAVFEPGMRGPGPGYREFQAALAARGATAGRLATGDHLTLDDLSLRVLWPDRASVPGSPPDDGTGINNVSIVLLGTFGAERMLLAGDIEQEIDPILLARGLPRVDLLKVAHHGSRTSSTGEFLDAVRPKVAVVSVGARNPYGHPAPATIDRLVAHRAEVFRTDRNGSVEVDLDGRALTVSRDRGDPAVAAAFAVGTTSGSAPTSPVALGIAGCVIPRPRPVGPVGADGGAPADAQGDATPRGYDRPDERARAGRGRLAPARRGSPDVAQPACPSGGRGRVVVGTRRRPPRELRPTGGRDRRAPARRRQGASGRGARAQAAPRRRLGGVAAERRPP
jgi:competence protein ComEC